MSFQSRYQTLNTNQKRAVDTIDGPVMVVAGPGTGKTELLGMRAANILRQTDTLPESILCLTFTDSGAQAMRERLAQIIGKDAYKVAIHTFHSFGSEVINQNSEYFYQGAHFRPADELSTHEIITSILDSLEYDSPLASKMNGKYSHAKDTVKAISELKRSGLTSDELLQILDDNDATLDAIEPLVAEIFSAGRIAKATIEKLTPVAHRAAALPSSPLPAGITPLSTTLALGLAHAVDAATDDNSTKPVTAWKNTWLTKNSDGAFVFKDRARHEKLRAVSYVYFQYLSRMQEAELYDYDDMILRVVHALEIFDELRLNLQERYQYIMVDEFQDTNLSQMRILHSLTDNQANEGMPNILVVGDDDQAIYSFQGADVSNILNFRTTYPRTTVIPLVDNYRSGAPILDVSRGIIRQGSDRLEQHIEELDKTLTAHRPGDASVSLYEAASSTEERQWIVARIKQLISDGTAPRDIAVLTRNHSEIIDLLPYFAKEGIAVAYERRDNVLELAPVSLLIQTARVISLLASQQLDEANGLLPEVLSHPAWNISTNDLWALSMKSYDGRTRWIDTMATLPEFTELHTFFIQAARDVHTEPLELMLDRLIGQPSDAGDTVASPLYNYFFSADALARDPSLYIRYLEGLRTIRSALKDHADVTEPNLLSFVAFIDLLEQADSTLTSVHQPSSLANGVNLMTAHKSKGLEFDTVFIANAIESKWGERVRSPSPTISYPENLPLAAAGNSPDERLRLFFVAVTRAKQQLIMSYSTTNDAGKSTERAGFLMSLDAIPMELAGTDNIEQLQAEQRWYTRHTEPKQDLKTLLQPTLDTYKLSATHLGSFLDVTRGGPEAFLVKNLLRFPQAMSPAAAYGSAIHATLQRAHSHLAATKKQRALEDILGDYETELSQHRLRSSDRETYSQKGAATLQAFLAAKYDSFTPTQRVELNFAGQQSIVDGAHLTGKLDLVDINDTDKTIVVTDYKTGTPSQNWKGSSDYKKISLHKYRQQLMFYKLLVEHARNYRDYTVIGGVLQFVEPTKTGDIVILEDDFSESELDTFRQLLVAVWNKITSLDLPKTDHYDQTYKGVLAFEQDLLDGKV